MTVTNTVTETEHLTPLRSAVEHINWNTLYQQKMALEEVSDMLYAKRKEDDTFGKASAWTKRRPRDSAPGQPARQVRRRARHRPAQGNPSGKRSSRLRHPLSGHSRETGSRPPRRRFGGIGSYGIVF